MPPAHESGAPRQESAASNQVSGTATDTRTTQGTGEVFPAPAHSKSTTPEPWILPRQRSDKSAQAKRHNTELDAARTEAHKVAQERRDRVLLHEDLRDAVCEALRLTRANNWNGYVPPALDAYGKRNSSIQRADLVAICAEAMRREQGTRVSE